jgi:mannose-1-phosphate guanylyltransferase
MEDNRMDKLKTETRGIILAGGEGKRLRPLSYYFQKCMIPLGNQQKPLLEYIVRLMRYYNIEDIALLVGYKHEQIVNYFNSGQRFGVSITYVPDEPSLKGTGGALLNMYHKGLIGSHDLLLIYYGDIVSDIDLSEMIAQHKDKRAVATLALSKGYQLPVGVAEVKGGAVTDWTEKPHLELSIGTGILILNSSALPELGLLSAKYSTLDIMTHLIPHLIQKGDLVSAYETDAFWYDVGSTERYEKVDHDLIDKCFARILPSPGTIAFSK